MSNLIRVQQLNPIIGDVEGNTTSICKAIKKAENDEIDLLLLPELVVCGYSAMDFLERPAFRDRIYRANKTIAGHTNETAVIFGTISANNCDTGKVCFNSAIFAYQGAIKADIHKTLLPTYNVFDEQRYFEPNKAFECIEFQGRKIGVTICEDIWCNYGNNPSVRYDVNPVKKLADLGAEAIFNLSASPFDKSKHRVRVEMINEKVEQSGLPIFYANQVGGNTGLISDGDSLIMDGNQNLIARAPIFEEAYIDVEWSKNKIQTVSGGIAETPSKQERIFKALCYGLKEYMRKSGTGDEAIIGLSGGIDSALVACIATEALGAENVTCVAMPSSFSSESSVQDAKQLTKNLGIELEKFSINKIYEKSLEALNPLFKGTSFDTAEENLQARIRGMLLMGISNKLGGLVLNPGNKSEASVGYSTLYGDTVGAIAVIGDLFKTEVYQLAARLNQEYYQEEILPQFILEKAPSAELRPDQKDTDSLPPYKILDAILKLYIERRKSIKEIAAEGYDEETVSKVVSLFHKSEYKRSQAPPALKISYTSLSSLRRPIVSKL